jgi:membrane protein required for colicin V production
MPVTILDLVVIGIVTISGLLAMVRGFTREVLAIGSWAVAAVVGYFFFPKAAPLVMQYITKNPPALVNGLAFGGVFLVTLFIAYIITSKLSDFILDSRVGALDRTLGFLFGVARGLLLIVVAVAFWNWLVGPEQSPSWIKEAKSKPFLDTLVARLQTALPAEIDLWVRERMAGATGEGEAQGQQSAPAEDAPKP